MHLKLKVKHFCPISWIHAGVFHTRLLQWQPLKLNLPLCTLYMALGLIYYYVDQTVCKSSKTLKISNFTLHAPFNYWYVESFNYNLYIFLTGTLGSMLKILYGNNLYPQGRGSGNRYSLGFNDKKKIKLSLLIKVHLWRKRKKIKYWRASSQILECSTGYAIFQELCPCFKKII